MYAGAWLWDLFIESTGSRHKQLAICLVTTGTAGCRVIVALGEIPIFDNQPISSPMQAAGHTCIHRSRRVGDPNDRAAAMSRIW